LALYYQHGAVTGLYTFDLPTLARWVVPAGPAQSLMFLAFALAFAIKVPVFPFHTWLPDAHVEAPTAGSVILAGVLLKMGTYGFVRFALPFFPDVVMHPKVRGWMIALSIIGIIYGALVSLMQKDMKKLVAYSSVSHLGFCTLGIFALNPAGLSGSVLQQINHGISTGALFLIVGILYERRHTREILTFVPLIIMALWIGLYPKPFFQILEQPVNQIVQTVRPGYPGASPAVNAAVQPSPADSSMQLASKNEKGKK